MYVSPQITDLGSFQELTRGSMQAATGGVMGPIGSLLNSTGDAFGEALDSLPGVSVDDNSRVGTDEIVIDPSITVTPR